MGPSKKTPTFGFTGCAVRSERVAGISSRDEAESFSFKKLDGLSCEQAHILEKAREAEQNRTTAVWLVSYVGERRMRLTLRTLLAWLDDTLPPTQVREIGRQVSESTYAQELVERIHRVTRQRQLDGSEQVRS